MIDFYIERKGKKPTTIKELQDLTFEDMKEYQTKNSPGAANVLDGIVIPLDPYEVYNRCIGDDFIVMQGSTTNDYDYFKQVFEKMYAKYGINHDDCGKATYWYLTEPNK